MRRILGALALLFVACTSPSYSGIDSPSIRVDHDSQNIIAYIDQRLENEYYWLDEVKSKSGMFNRHVAWQNYLSASLSRLETNTDDGYINKRGQRVFYSYIGEVEEQTRSAATGFGIDLHYTIAVIDSDNGYYGFLVENIYPNSPAAVADMRRGDVIMMVNGKNIDANNYAELFTTIQNNTASNVRLQYRRQTDGQSYAATLDHGIYTPTTVIHNEILSIEGHSDAVGYLAYTGFESEYDEELMAAITSFATAGVQDVILDLRCNGGGEIRSAVKLASAILPAAYEGQPLCIIKRNPKNSINDVEQSFPLSNTGAILSLQRLIVICSGYSASASELIIMGLRGLDIPVMLIGATTEGKNCGMDVTRRKVGNTHVEFAPITFMCFNAKGFGEWGEGITPDVDLTTENDYGISDKNYPLPRCPWGDVEHDVALRVAISAITGQAPTATRHEATASHLTTLDIDRPTMGLRLMAEE